MNLTTSPIVYLHANDAAAYYCKFNDATGQWVCESGMVGVEAWGYVTLIVGVIGLAMFTIWRCNCS